MSTHNQLVSEYVQHILAEQAYEEQIELDKLNQIVENKGGFTITRPDNSIKPLDRSIF